MRMTEMIYSDGDLRCPSVLDFGEYRGIKYIILNRHMFPCSYIAADAEYGEVVDRYCHYGVAYSGNRVPGVESTKGPNWFGWDYGHWGDYMKLSIASDGKKWTTEELIQEVHGVIDKVKEAMEDG